jgi:hypothetical protein
MMIINCDCWFDTNDDEDDDIGAVEWIWVIDCDCWFDTNDDFFQNGVTAFVLACESKQWGVADILYNKADTLIIPENSVWHGWMYK